MNYAIGIDIGGTYIKSGLVNEKGNIIYFHQEKTYQDGLEPIDAIYKCIDNILSNSGINSTSIIGIGVGTPGTIDVIHGVVDYSSNLKWEHYPLKDLIENKYHKTTRVINDANAATYGEFLYGGHGKINNAVMLTLGTGVGGGIIIDGKLFEGNLGKAGELGHITLILDGLPCGCGRAGCFEQYASTRALVNQCREALKSHPESLIHKLINNEDELDGITIFKALKQGDKMTAQVLDRYIKYLSEGIMNYCNIFRPDAIILGGGIAEEKEYLLSKIQSYCLKYHYGYRHTPKVAILAANLGNKAGIIGAASLFLK